MDADVKRIVLGEMHARLMGPESFVSLPRTGGVAYAAQESWVLSDTIRVSDRASYLFGANSERFVAC